jgi:cell wall-associated NlpC family hydrolase
VSAGGASQQGTVRVGAYATMGLSAVDAVVSHAQAQKLGLPQANALVISAPKTDLNKVIKKLCQVLPREAKTVVVGPTTGSPDLRSNGRTMSPEQIGTAIQEAQKQLGVPYVWGGESLAEGGFDCSGLVQWAFAKVGVRMPRVAADQAKTGPRLAFQQAQPGDLLFWTIDPTAPGYISHEAIYLGGDKMLVAPRTGDVVKIQKVYFKGFWGAVRVDPKLSARLAGRP